MFKNTLKGIQAYFNTFQLISKLKLWRYFGIPILISVLTAASVGLLAWGLSDNIGAFIAKIWPWDWGSVTFRTISDVIGAIAIVVLGLVLYKHIVMALSAPFMSPVSEKIEYHITGKTPSKSNSNTTQLLRGIRINVRNLLMELLITIPILLLSFIPVVSILTSIILFLVQSYYAGFGNMDYTLERHFTYRESISFVSRNKGLALGNGILFMAMLLIPVLGIILVLPLSVTAASSETVKILQQERALKEHKNI